MVKLIKKVYKWVGFFFFMAFICEDCGLEKLDEDKYRVVDGIKIKEICSKCLDSEHIVISQLNEAEVNRRLLLAYKPKRFGEKAKIELQKIKRPEDEFRRKIRMMRIEKGLTIAQLADILKINPKDLENFEKGIVEDLYIRKKLIDFFNIRLIEKASEKEKFKAKEIDFKSNIKLNELLEEDFQNGG